MLLLHKERKKSLGKHWGSRKRGGREEPFVGGYLTAPPPPHSSALSLSLLPPMGEIFLASDAFPLLSEYMEAGETEKERRSVSTECFDQLCKSNEWETKFLIRDKREKKIKVFPFLDVTLYFWANTSWGQLVRAYVYAVRDMALFFLEGKEEREID